jgi:chaperonin GroEL
MKKIVTVGPEARKKLIKGIDTLADAVVSTLGPNGRNVVYSQFGTIHSTKDGVSIAKYIDELEDPIEEIGVKMLKQAATKTADLAGDGTTTSTLLAREIIKQSIKYLNNGSNAVDIKKGLEGATNEIISTLRNSLKEEISSEDQLTQIASISANNDKEIGYLISDAINKVGREGVVTIEESQSGETYLEVVEGIQFDRGYKSHHFVTNTSNMTAVLENCYILIADRKFSTAKDLLPILEAVSTTNKSLLIISDDIDGEALATLIVNKVRGSLKVVAVKAPDIGDRKKLILEDIAVLTGGVVFSPDKGMKIDKFSWDWLGQARNVIVTKDTTTIVDGKGQEDKIKQRIEELQSQIENSKTPFEQEKLQERLAKFIGGIAIIHVGGNTETEIKEKKDRVEDALYATKAAIDEGIVPGGGAALIHACKNLEIAGENTDVTIGRNIIYQACSKPLEQILTNAGYSINDIYDIINSVSKSKNTWKGFNVKVSKIVDMKEQGIIDPVKVTRIALENAVSVAKTVLLTECVVTEVVKEGQDNNPMNMGGLFN